MTNVGQVCAGTGGCTSVHPRSRVVPGDAGTVNPCRWRLRTVGVKTLGRILATLGAVVAIGLAIAAGTGVNGGSEGSYADAIDEALSNAELNEGLADSAPQQQVVNGWTARDLLTVQAEVMDEMLAAQQRGNNLIVLLVAAVAALAVGVAGAAFEVGARESTRNSNDLTYPERRPVRKLPRWKWTGGDDAT